jgi:hypothetical protein
LHFDEYYSDADARDRAVTDSGVFTLSYGEYVPACDGVDYASFVSRSEELLQFHYSFLEADCGITQDRFKVIRREWLCATNPDIAVVHLYVRS